MINSKEGKVVAEGSEIEVMADLACVIRGIHEVKEEKGNHPILSALRILKYVIIGLAYKGDE